ncbi:MAG: exosortase/archaeosortase family protein [Gemmatimonadaceae bacterium]
MAVSLIPGARWAAVAARSPLRMLPAAVTAIAFIALFARPMALLGRDWWSDPESSHGLLLVPVALWLAWRTGVRRTSPNLGLGLALLLMAVLTRHASALAAELYTMRMSMLLALAALVICFLGVRQLVRWWLPFTVLVLSVPLPEVVLGAITLPLQHTASRLGAFMLDARYIPVQLSGNIIRLPGQELFVTEACSGLRSLTALLSLGVLIAGCFLSRTPGRLFVIAAAIPIAILANGVRIFFTGFMVHHVSADAGTGFLHYTEGWLMFVVALMGLGALAAGVTAVDRVLSRRGAR